MLAKITKNNYPVIHKVMCNIDADIPVHYIEVNSGDLADFESALAEISPSTFREFCDECDGIAGLEQKFSNIAHFITAFHQVDISDIPEADEEFFEKAVVKKPRAPRKPRRKKS